MEGKEVRFGQALSALYVVATTGLSCGAVNAMHNSLTPLGGLVPLFLIQLGEILPGGVGSGLYGMIVIAILTVFIAGLMVGRTPEYLGKKIEAREMKLAMLALLILPLAILGFSAAAAMLPTALESLANAGPHGLTEILYAYSSAAGNNGSAFAGLTANTPWYNTTLGIAMLLGRFAYVVPVMAIAGALAAKKKVPASSGTFPTHGAAVRRPAHRRDPDPRRPAVFPGARARPDRRALPDARRQDVLKELHPMTTKAIPLLDAGILRQAALDAVAKLAPAKLVRNPVMFVTGVVALLVTLLFVRDLVIGRGGLLFSGQIAAWLWFTVLFANFAEAIAEGRGKAHADALRRTRSETHGQASAASRRSQGRSVGAEGRAICSRSATSCSSRPATPFRPTAR